MQKRLAKTVILLAALTISSSALADKKAYDYLQEQKAAQTSLEAKERLAIYLNGLLDGIVGAEARNRQLGNGNLVCPPTGRKITYEDLVRAIDMTLYAVSRNSKYDAKKTSVSTHALIGLEKLFPCPKK